MQRSPHSFFSLKDKLLLLCTFHLEIDFGVIGSNIFNLLFILGISALIHPVSINMASVYDLIILVAVSGISYIYAFTSRKIACGEGIMMLMIYAADVVFAILR